MPTARSYGKSGGKGIKVSLPESVLETLSRARWAWRRETVATLRAIRKR